MFAPGGKVPTEEIKEDSKQVSKAMTIIVFGVLEQRVEACLGKQH